MAKVGSYEAEELLYPWEIEEAEERGVPLDEYAKRKVRDLVQAAMEKLNKKLH